MQIHVTINGEKRTLTIAPHERLLRVLRREAYFSVKFGDEHGLTGSDTVLLDGEPVNAQTMLAAQADGHDILTLEGLGSSRNLHILQQCFIETGAIQSGYTTPAQILVAYALLQRNPNPTEAEIREALAGVLDRETGYVKVVQAIQRASAILRGEDVPPFQPLERAIPAPPGLFDVPFELPNPDDFGSDAVQTRTRTIPAVVVSPPEIQEMKTIGKPEPKVDAVKLAAGKPVYADDIEMRGMLHAAMLTSPHAHARIVKIDASKARALPGVHAVLTHEDIPRVYYASGGQSYPNPLPYDQVSLDNKVRHVGDRVAVVAAETPEIAREALKLIDVTYEVLPAVFDPLEAMQPGAPVIHDEPDVEGIYDAQRNIVHHIHAEAGDAQAQWAKADHIFEGEYCVHQVQQCSIEPHIVVTWWDEDDRLVIRTSTQVPFHVRRMIAPLLGLPVKRIRVIKPRIGGGFGGKQEMLIEDLCAHLTIATGRPVRFEYSREQEFTSARSRHPQVLRFKTGVTKDGEVVASELYIAGNTGAYGTHGLTVQMVSGFRGLSTYNAPYSKFVCDVVYTNIPTPGAYRGYGAPQALHALEVHMEEIAQALGMDVIEFKRKNWIKKDEPLIMAVALGEGREGKPQVVTTTALDECVEIGARAVHWYEKRGKPRHVPGKPHLKRGIGMAVAMHGTGIAGLDMGAASIKLNDDGSFNLLFGATDLGTGADTVLAQIAAETLGVPVEDIIVYAADTDMTPFDTGAYASSTTYISGGAVLKAAEKVRQQILSHAAKYLLNCEPDELELEDRLVKHQDGRSVTLEQVALHSLHQENQHQIMATASHMSEISPPPFAAQFAEVIVDTQTGQVTVERLLMAVDCGIAINPITASGQVEGGMVQALGYAHCEEMAYDQAGRPLATNFREYHIYRADEMPELDVIFVETYEPSGPFGAKAVAEIPKDAVAPALSSAIFDATGVRIRDLPYTPERVWQALRK
ncbi:MAG: xanthine dehydrogenase [Phototrophicales bacterium]|nr:MAG: xanthine dehydrogenase [Phototrophicales bacterium]RMG75908.1 MAG: xanthine dehydrogenase [Chloroflexota bacterium]